MDRLIEGYLRFRESLWPQLRDLYRSLAAHGQTPYAAVVACSDSRVDPQMILGCAPGELFIVRNVANLVPPYSPNADYHGTSAALEFAVQGLKVGHIIVLGHAQCGGIAALLRGPKDGCTDFVPTWMEIAGRARELSLALAGGAIDAAERLCEREGLKVSVENLMSFPWVRERVVAGDLKLHAWFFSIETGLLERLDKNGRFIPLDGDELAALAHKAVEPAVEPTPVPTR